MSDILREALEKIADEKTEGEMGYCYTTLALVRHITREALASRQSEPDLLRAEKPETPIDDLLLQEVYSLREKLKISVEAIKAHDPNFDAPLFIHQLNSVDFEQLMEELSEPDPKSEGRMCDHEPGESYLKGNCPVCGNPLQIVYGDDTGELRVMGLDAKGFIRETFWNEPATSDRKGETK